MKRDRRITPLPLWNVQDRWLTTATRYT